MNLAITRILHGGSLQELHCLLRTHPRRKLHGRFEAVVALHWRCCVRVLQSRRQQKRASRVTLIGFTSATNVARIGISDFNGHSIL